MQLTASVAFFYGKTTHSIIMFFWKVGCSLAVILLVSKGDIKRRHLKQPMCCGDGGTGEIAFSVFGYA